MLHTLCRHFLYKNVQIYYESYDDDDIMMMAKTTMKTIMTYDDGE